MPEVRAYDVASMFLRALGAPDTTSMRRAVAIWLRFESGGRITGNNPWNLHSGDPCPASKGYCPGNGSLPGQIGNRYAGPGDRNVAVFATLNDGVKASANNLIRLSPNYGYGKVIAEARSGDAVGFLSALQQSSWSAGHYGYSKLVNAFASAFNYNTLLTTSMPTGPINTPSPDTDKITADIVALFKKLGIPTDLNHVFTEADLEKLMSAYVDQYPGLKPGTDLYNKLLDELKEKWLGKTVADYIKAQTTLGDSPLIDIPNPLDPLEQFLTTAGTAIGFLLDAQNWLYIFALVGGIGLTAYGFTSLVGARMPIPSVDGLQ